jgi:hypothetical protein
MFEAERRLLPALPILSEPFDQAVNRLVQLDGTVSFEGRVYRVPFLLPGLQVKVRGYAGVVQVLSGERRYHLEGQGPSLQEPAAQHFVGQSVVDAGLAGRPHAGPRDPGSQSVGKRATTSGLLTN